MKLKYLNHTLTLIWEVEKWKKKYAKYKEDAHSTSLRREGGGGGGGAILKGTVPWT